MKTFLLAFLFLFTIAFNKAAAQSCSLANLQFEKTYTGSDGKCYVDVTFDMDKNNGNKAIYLHFWSSENYSKIDKSKFESGGGPGFAEINGTSDNPHPAVATVAINQFGNSAPEWSSYDYRPDNNVVVVKGSSLQLSGSPVSGSGSSAMYRYSIKAIPLDVAGGGCSADNLKAIVWSTQANTEQSQIHCTIVDIEESPFEISGMTSCVSGKYTLNVKNKSDKAISGSIDMFSSKNQNAKKDMSKFDEISYFFAEPGQTFTISRPIPAKYLNYYIFSQVSLSNKVTQMGQLNSVACGLLPIRMKSFTAIRVKQNVDVKWETELEQRVRGFNILRLTNKGDWQIVAFVPSQAEGGYSAKSLTYQHIDLNPQKGISQYRIQEVSIDGKTSLSEIRAVRGEEQSKGFTMYPNPSTNGKVAIVFNNESVKDVLVLDMSGRIVKQSKGVVASNVLFDNLGNGYYNVQIIDRMSGEITTEKLIVR